MSGGEVYVLAALLVLGVNMLPVLAPPTWAVLVLVRLTADTATLPLVVVGACAAASGRLLLALGFRRLSAWLPRRYVANVTAAGSLVTERPRAMILGLAVFALSPVPSAQLFEAAGLMSVRLRPLTLAFFAGRLVSYTVYVSGASALRNSGAGELLTDSLVSPWGIAVQVLLLVGLIQLGRVDWVGIRARRTVAAGPVAVVRRHPR